MNLKQFKKDNCKKKKNYVKIISFIIIKTYNAYSKTLCITK